MFRDTFSACLGDAYHAMSRAKVPVKHEFKKPYFVALQQAFFAWKPDLLAEVKQVLGSNGFSNQDIEAKMYYDVDFFRQWGKLTNTTTTPAVLASKSCLCIIW